MSTAKLPTGSRHDSGRFQAVLLRPSGSTNLHNAERTRKVADVYGDSRFAPSTTLSSPTAARRRNRGTVPALRAMSNDAMRPQAGRLVALNPFAGSARPGRGRRDLQPPVRLTPPGLSADELTPPSFAAYLHTAMHSPHSSPRRV